MNAKQIIYSAAIFISLTSLARGRWKTPEEAATSSVSAMVQINVKKDGSFRSDRETVSEIKNEAGRTQLGTVAFTYNTRAGMLKVLGAETRIGGQIIPVRPDLIEDKPVATNLSAFDQINQIKVSFPKVEVGSKIYLRTSSEVLEVPIPGHFDTFQEFGNGYIEENTKIVISSEMPFEFLLNDPADTLHKKYELRGGLHTLTVWQEKPIYNELTNEETNSVIPLKKRTWLMVSTTKTYEDLTKGTVKEYDKITSQPIPDEFADILKAAQEQKSVVEAANKVTSMLADKLRYMGDWRPVKGGHIPRPLEEIAATHFGDCKDMAAMTAAILKKLGYTASIAWVYRSNGQHESGPLVNVSYFNHAIVKVENSGACYWLDPTNAYSFAHGIPSDICDRQAVVLDAHPHAENIACPQPNDSVVRNNCVLKFSPNGDALAKYCLSYIGSSASEFAGSERNFSKEEIQDNITNYLAGNRYVFSKEFGSIDLKSRIVQDIELKADLGVRGAVSKSTAGFVYPMSTSGLDLYRKIKPDEFVSDLLLGVPQEYVSKTVLKNVNLVGSLPKPSVVDSPWFKVSRSVTVNGKDLEIEERTVSLTSEISNEAIKSPEFERVQAEIQDRLGEYSLIFTTDPDTGEVSVPQ